MAIKNQKHSCHRFGRPRFNEPPPHLSDFVAEIFDRKVAEASLTPPKLGLTGRRENGRAPRLTCLRSPLAWDGTFPRGLQSKLREAPSPDSPQLRAYARRVEGFHGRREPSNVRKRFRRDR